MIRPEQGGALRRELIGFAGIVERNMYLIRRFAWWELAWFLYTVANTLTIVFIAKGIEAGGGHLDVNRPSVRGRGGVPFHQLRRRQLRRRGPGAADQLRVVHRHRHDDGGAAADLAREGHPAGIHRPGAAAGGVGGLLPGHGAARLDAVAVGDLAGHLYARGLSQRDPGRGQRVADVAGHLAAARDRRHRRTAGPGGVPARRALLETDELIVRSPFRLTVPRAGIRSATAAGEALEVVYDGGALTLRLGEREAAKWAADIANPKTLADKLGVKAGQRVRLVGGADAELVGAGRLVADGEADVAFLAAEAPSELTQIARLRDEIARDGAIWVIRPKGRDDLTEGMVIAAGRGAGMHDIKIARISNTHTGMKFVIPVEQR